MDFVVKSQEITFFDLRRSKIDFLYINIMIITFHYTLITQASVRKKKKKNAGCFWSHKGGVMVPGIANVGRGSWGRERVHLSVSSAGFS